MKVICLVVALASVGLGALGLVHLSAAYRPIDVAYKETPVGFGLWLEKEATRLKDEPDTLADVIALRLVTQPIATRYRLIRALLGKEYWRQLAPGPRDRMVLRLAVLRGTERALENAPSGSGLWLLASILRTSTDGFNERAASYLRASYVFSGRELSFALPRLTFSAIVWSVLPEDLRQQARINAVLVETMAPDLGEKIRDVFATANVNLD